MHLKIAFTTFCLALFLIAQSQYSKIGSDLNNTLSGAFFGQSVAISANGKIVAVGAPFGLSADSGFVEVFTEVNGQWQRLNDVIRGTHPDNFLGHQVALSDDGLRVATLGATLQSAAASVVRVYDAVNGLWVQRGVDILPKTSSEYFLPSLGLSSTGNRLVIGVEDSSATGKSVGMLRAYQLQGGAWAQLGGDLPGDSAGDRFGFYSAMSGDGFTIAGGSRLAPNAGPDSARGVVKVYQWSGSAWVQAGGDITGTGAGEQFGSTLSLSDDGKSFASSATFSLDSFSIGGFGAVRVYDLLGGQWSQRGADLRHNHPQELYGGSAALSGDGNHLVVGTPSTILNDGKVNVWRWDGSAWQDRDTILGNAGTFTLERFGTAVNINNDGSRIIVGSPKFNGNKGRALVYEDGQAMSLTDFGVLGGVAVFASLDFIYIKSEETLHQPTLRTYDLKGRLVAETHLENGDFYQIPHSLKAGIYIIKIEAAGKMYTEKTAVF